MTPFKTIQAARAALIAALALASTAVTTTEAGAVSLAVKLACASDYYAHCSQHKPDSPGVRQCMRAVGAGLSKRCLSALVAAGEAPKSALGKEVANAE